MPLIRRAPKGMHRLYGTHEIVWAMTTLEHKQVHPVYMTVKGQRFEECKCPPDVDCDHPCAPTEAKDGRELREIVEDVLPDDGTVYITRIRQPNRDEANSEGSVSYFDVGTAEEARARLVRLRDELEKAYGRKGDGVRAWLNTYAVTADGLELPREETR